MRANPFLTPAQRGRLFESVWAKIFGVEPQRGSGNKWYAKMDVADGQILWSLKHTDKESFSVSKKLFGEVQQAIFGMGGVGGTTIPGIATEVGEDQYVTLRAEDFMRLMTENVRYITPSVDEQKRSRANTPMLARDEEC